MYSVDEIVSPGLTICGTRKNSSTSGKEGEGSQLGVNMCFDYSEDDDALIDPRTRHLCFGLEALAAIFL